MDRRVIHAASAIRLALVSPLAALAAVCLLLLMAWLIAGAETPPEPAEERVEVVIADVQDDPPRVIRMMQLPEPLMAPPPVAPLKVDSPIPDGFQGVETSEVVFDRIDISELSPIGVVRTPTTPQVRIPPSYPMREQEMGVEGSCRVVYDVTREGRTTNIDVSDCDSPGSRGRHSSLWSNGVMSRSTVMTATSRYAAFPRIFNSP